MTNQKAVVCKEKPSYAKSDRKTRYASPKKTYGASLGLGNEFGGEQVRKAELAEHRIKRSIRWGKAQRPGCAEAS